jgi:hypothetical protein
MLAKALDGVFAGLPGRDQERPIRALQQQDLAGCLL